MALKFIKQKRKITTGFSPGEKFVAKILQDDVIDTRKLSEIIAETSSLSRGDILSVLAQLETVIGWALQEGNAVPSVYFVKKIKELKVTIQKLDFKGLVIKGQEENP